jgi:phosphatidylglycerol:prolipoprotein diacylglycerol transferase
MFPYIKIFGRYIGMYPIMVLCGIFAAGVYVCYITKKEGHDDNEAIIFLLISSIGVFLGGHILYGLVNYRSTVFFIKKSGTVESFQKFRSLFTAAFGGSVFFGGLTGGISAAFFYLKKRKNQEYLVDIAASAIPLFHFFGRIGCFLGGCCFGIESPFGFTALHGIVDEANGVNRFPVQLLESLFNGILFFVLARLRKAGYFRNRVLYLYLLSYSTGRFFIEFLRGDGYRGKWLFLSTSQIISLLIFGIAIIKYSVTIRPSAGYSGNRRNEGAFTPEMRRLGAKGS